MPPAPDQAVIFDIDGTLLDSADVDDALYRDAVRVVLGNVRFRPSLAHYDCVTDTGVLTQLLADNSIPGSPDVVANVKREFLALMSSYIAENGPFAEIPGAHGFVARLVASDGHRVAFATGGWEPTARLKLESAGMGDFDIPLATSDDASDRREIMRIALAKLGPSFDSVTYYGDGPWDREASDQLGWAFVAVGPALNGLRSYDG